MKANGVCVHVCKNVVDMGLKGRCIHDFLASREESTGAPHHSPHLHLVAPIENKAKTRYFLSLLKSSQKAETSQRRRSKTER